MGMIDSVVHAFGKAIRPLHAGEKKLLIRQAELAGAREARLVVTSSAFTPGGPIPRRYTQDAENVSPPLAWTFVPEGTRSLVLVCEDPDAPFPQPFVHWVIYALPADARALTEASHEGAPQGKNSAKHTGYDGPAPPKGHGVHHYHFQVFALDTTLTFVAQPTRDDVAQAMRGHVIASGEVVGTYER